MGIPQGTTVATSFVGDGLDKQAAIDELLQSLSIVKPHKVYIKANKKDEARLREVIDFEIIPPYEFKKT
jgi:hypothetical protein